MTTKIDQKAYLQKYLSGPSGDKKKKKKKKVIKGKGFKIIDDDIDISKIQPIDSDELDILGEGEDAPQIAGIIDERPEEIKKLEQFKTSSKWRVINQDDGFNSKIQIEEIKKDIKEKEKENEIIFGKMYSDSEDEKQNDSDLSPPRRNSLNQKEKSKSNSKDLPTNNDESDVCPPRKSDSNSKNRTKKPSRWGIADVSIEKSRQESPDSDLSPPRKSRKSNSPNRKSNKESYHKRKTSPSFQSSPNRNSHKNEQRKDYDSPKNSKVEYSYNNNSRKELHHHRRKSSSDLSPPRKSQVDRQKNYDSNESPSRKSTKPDRKRLHSPSIDISAKKQKTPNNKYNKHKEISDKYMDHHTKRSRQSPDSDLSPPRRNRNTGMHSNKNKRIYERSSDSPPPSNKKMERTLDGKKAGLQNAEQLQHENQEFRRREDEIFSKMSDELSGRNAQIVSRKSKRENSEERQKQRDKAERQKILDEKYKKWSKGLKQVEAQEARIQDYLHEASKPLARHKDDRDLENRLKDVERDGDPMLQYMREKKKDAGLLGPERPSYKGSYPPNRFNIRPGYRWDGVDRSNGYEKKYFETQSKKKAQEEEAYKWSTEDL